MISLIIGNAEHPEVQGIMGWAVNREVTVVQNAEEAEQFKLPDDKPKSLCCFTNDI